MIKSYDLPNGRKMTADFDENGIGKITVQALDSLVSELNHYATPCEDAVSRQAVYEILEGNWNTDFLHAEVEQLPSVQPKQKTGRWIRTDTEHKCYARDDTYTTTEYHCSECGAEPLAEYAGDDAREALSDYCPSCGLYMKGGE